MSWQLKHYAHSPPGNFSYVQTVGHRHVFPALPSIEEVAKAVSQFRSANRLPRASLGESLEDVDAYTCARIRNHPDWCWEAQQSFQETHSGHPFFRACPTCGQPVT